MQLSLSLSFSNKMTARLPKKERPNLSSVANCAVAEIVAPFDQAEPATPSSITSMSAKDPEASMKTIFYIRDDQPLFLDWPSEPEEADTAFGSYTVGPTSKPRRPDPSGLGISAREDSERCWSEATCSHMLADAQARALSPGATPRVYGLSPSLSYDDEEHSYTYSSGRQAESFTVTRRVVRCGQGEEESGGGSTKGAGLSGRGGRTKALLRKMFFKTPKTGRKTVPDSETSAKAPRLSTSPPAEPGAEAGGSKPMDDDGQGPAPWQETVVHLPFKQQRDDFEPGECCGSDGLYGWTLVLR